MSEWCFYLIKNNNCTYAGVSPDPIRRLRQHNKEIKGGAKYTTNKAPGWTHLCIVRGFRTKIESMQFEWAVKHAPPRGVGGVKNRIQKLYHVCCQEKWTTRAPNAKEIPLTIYWHIPIPKENIVLPCHVIQEQS